MHVHPDPRSVTAARIMSVAAIRARMAMLAVAYAAKNGAVNRIEIADASQRIVTVFGSDHDLAREMAWFVTSLPLLRRHVPDLVAAGDRLIRAVERTTWPDRGGRADING